MLVGYNILQSAETLAQFVRVGLEMVRDFAIGRSHETQPAPIFQNEARVEVYFPVDCLAYLVVFLVRRFSPELTTFCYKVRAFF